MSLADQIITAKTSAAQNFHTDEYGIPDEVKNIDYYCARAIKINKYLHREDGRLFNGRIEVTQKATDIAVLTQSLKMSANMAALVYDRLLSLVPWLDESCIAVTPHLLWHKDTGELEEVEDEIPVTSPWE